uniref:Uncharacterized protein n=1 Tax=Oryza brachyantha TaxID=4533 RepID=J3MWX5_ORYBR
MALRASSNLQVGILSAITLLFSVPVLGTGCSLSALGRNQDAAGEGAISGRGCIDTVKTLQVLFPLEVCASMIKQRDVVPREKVYCFDQRKFQLPTTAVSVCCLRDHGPHVAATALSPLNSNPRFDPAAVRTSTALGCGLVVAMTVLFTQAATDGRGKGAGAPRSRRWRFCCS